MLSFILTCSWFCLLIFMYIFGYVFQKENIVSSHQQKRTHQQKIWGGTEAPSASPPPFLLRRAWWSSFICILDLRKHRGHLWYHFVWSIQHSSLALLISFFWIFHSSYFPRFLWIQDQQLTVNIAEPHKLSWIFFHHNRSQ